MRKSAKGIVFVLSLAALVASAFAAEGPTFLSKPLLAGRASLTEDGFVVGRSFGTANFTPELAWPVQLVYESASERTGIFGYAWRSPQLESSAAWDKDGVLWTTPWGEKIKFHPKKEKLPKDAVKVALYEEAKKGRGFYAPYADWEADTASSSPAKTGDWTFTGKRTCAGWTLAYRNGRLSRVDAPSGRSISFSYDKAGCPVSISQDGVAFVELAYDANGLAESVKVNGVETRLAYANGPLAILPKTIDGQIVPAARPRLVSLQIANLDAETFGYAGNYLSRISQGAHVEELKVQNETLADRKRNIRSAQPKSKVEHTGRIAGRLLADNTYTYAYGKKTGVVSVTDLAGRTASYSFDGKTGVFGITEFTGRKHTIYYFMRYDVAYLGKVRKVVDGKGRDVVSFRYDKSTGRPTRVRDRLGNDVNLEWDDAGRPVRETRRVAGSAEVEPVRSFTCDKAGNVIAASILDADGNAVRTTTVAYDKEYRPVRLSDGRREVKVGYTRWGRPAPVTDSLGRTTAFEYDRWNRPVKATTPDGIVTTCSYTPAGQVARMDRRAGDELAQSVEVKYDGVGRPISYTDQDGRTKRYDRDAFGRVAKEIFPDASEVGYAYDGAGRLASVLDENRHKIQFGWDAGGIASRTTAAGQLTDYVRDDYGLLKEIVSSKDGKSERTIKREYDKFDRVAKIVYGPGEVESFAYDARGRLAKHTRGKTAETYSYDHFGNLAEKCEDGVTTSYAYDAWGQRTKRVTKDAEGNVISEETRTYDRYGRLAEIRSDGKGVRYSYDKAGRVARQDVDGRTIAFSYTKYGRLADKTLSGALGVLSKVRYWYGKDGKIVARLANGISQKYFYDAKGQLLKVVALDGTVCERYAYDPAGNILEKEIGGKVTRYEYDEANQLVSSTAPDGTVTKYVYDAAGRLVKEGSKTYRYGYLDKVLSVTEGKERHTFTYHADGQLATATRAADSGTPPGGSQLAATAAETETFLWDGLALIRRGTTSYVNEPHLNGGSPILSSRDGVMFNDILGTTVGTDGKDGYAAASLTAFGDPVSGGAHSCATNALFTGKPHVDGLGYAFLFRNYRSTFGKWQTADPLGYPDGWNRLAYCGNEPLMFLDFLGAVIIGCYDGNNIKSGVPSSLPTSSSSALRLVIGSQLHGGTECDDTVGEFRVGYIATQTTFGAAIKLILQINVLSSLDHDADCLPGRKSFYLPHDILPNDSISIDPVYEAVVEHERGHAKAFFSSWVASFRGKLENANVDDPSLSKEVFDSKIETAYRDAWEGHYGASGTAANAATQSWFDNNRSWQRLEMQMFDGQLYKGWEKKE